MLKQKWLLQLRAGQFKNAIATGEELIKVDTAAATLDFYNRQIGAAQSDSNAAKVQEWASKAAAEVPEGRELPAAARAELPQVGPAAAGARSRRAAPRRSIRRTRTRGCSPS